MNTGSLLYHYLGFCNTTHNDLGTLQRYLEVTPEQRRNAVAGKRVLKMVNVQVTSRERQALGSIAANYKEKLWSAEFSTAGWTWDYEFLSSCLL